MKKYIIILLLFISPVLGATNYYVKTGGNDGLSGTSDANAWATISKVNTIWNAGTFAPDDTIFFNKGDIFTGTLVAKESGTSGHPIVISAYGTGVNPIITGLTTLSSWTQVGATDVYYATIDVPRLNIVLIDDSLYWMGRYPDNGYLNYESHSGNTSITDNQLTDSPDWTGAEIGIRKYRWVIDRHVITNHTNGTLTYNALADWGNNAAYEPEDGNGYFFQNHLGCLDDLGDWYYDAATDRVYVDFGGGVPGSYTVQASNTAQTVTLSGYNYIELRNLTIQGSNNIGTYINAASYLTIEDCDFRYHGGDAIYGGNSNHITIKGGNITDVLNNGVFFEYDDDYNTVEDVTFNRIGYLLGSSKSGDGAGIAVFLNGTDNDIKLNDIYNTGYNGISSYGNNVLIENNYVNTSNLVKDDGGGIYVYGASYTGREIKNNIVLYATGSYAGAEGEYWEPFGKACGIYLDGYATNVTVTGNSVAHSGWDGLFSTAGTDNTVTGNTFYNNGISAIEFYYNTTYLTRNMVVNNNYFIAKDEGQYCMYISNTTKNENPNVIGTIDYNYYARPIDDDNVFRTLYGGDVTRTLEQWQSYTLEDLHSHKSPTSVADTADIDFYYNATALNDTIPVTDMIDMTATKYASQVILAPYTSIILIPDPSPDTPGLPEQNPLYQYKIFKNGKKVFYKGKFSILRD